jgi:hypothetical protein
MICRCTNLEDLIVNTRMLAAVLAALGPLAPAMASEFTHVRLETTQGEIVIALERRLAAPWGTRLRQWWSWGHLLLLWPLPTLLGFHILAVYYY